MKRRRFPLSIVILFTAALFFSSFLMFLVEPMVAKMVLPTLGGAPMVWNTCVAFFQVTLLVGYLCAHGASIWLEARRQRIMYLLLLAISFAALPVTIQSDSLPSDVGPISWLLLVLVISIGLPFFVLSTGTPVLQKWFAQTAHPAARDPYFLYAASNSGSLLALLAYPSVVEPTLRLRDQNHFWAIGYAVFAVLACACVAAVWRAGLPPGEPATAILMSDGQTSDARLSWRRRGKWVALAFVPSSLMLAVTGYLISDIASVPLLWIGPLSLYLLTFVLAFGSRGEYWRAIANRLLPLLVLPVVLFMTARLDAALAFAIPLHLLTFAMAALVCHGALASDRPPVSQLTEFYLWIAFGGMLGGLFNTLAAPVLFRSVVEYPLVLVLACLCRSRGGWPDGSLRHQMADLMIPLGVGALTFAALWFGRRLDINPGTVFAALALPAIVAFSQSRRPLRFALSVGAMLLAGSVIPNADSRLLHAERTFFGIYRVTQDPSGRHHELFHGTTLHGRQAVDQAHQSEPLSYYHQTGPFGEAFHQVPSISRGSEIAVVGLGIGSLASYAGAGQRWTFYEIDPAVERIARNPTYFTYLRDCGDRCRVVLGDARLSLSRALPNEYLLIVLDAFNSDAIPVHLMTSDAVSLYLTRLAPDGLLAFHISNRHLSLGPVLARLASAHGLVAVERVDRFKKGAWAEGKDESVWLVMARDKRGLGSLVRSEAWVTPTVSVSTPFWTDDFSNILGVLSLR